MNVSGFLWLIFARLRVCSAQDSWVGIAFSIRPGEWKGTGLEAGGSCLCSLHELFPKHLWAFDNHRL